MGALIIWLLIIVAGLLAMVSLILATFGLSFLVGAPFVATPKNIAKDMLEFAKLQPGETFIDLGSGSGSILFVAASEFKAKRVIGYEINPVLVLFSQLKAKWLKQSAVKTRRANFYTSNVEDADVVATYLWPSTMDALASKLKSDFKPETRVISRGFQFHHIEPREKKQSGPSTLYLYRVKDL